MRDMIVGVASGKIEDTVVLDLDKAEDNYGQADLPVGILPNTGEIAFLQMDGDLSIEEYNLAMEYNHKAPKRFMKSWLMRSSADMKEVKTDG